MGYSFKYGAVNIPYWINMDSFYQVVNITHRNTMISDIKYQLSLWDDVQINDGTGYFVNFYEVSPGREKLDVVDGHKVIEIRQEDLTANNWAGVFRPSEYSVSLCYDQTNKRINYNVDTIIHEFGHVLGLNDIDSANNVPYGTHKTLMSYNRGTTSATLNNAIRYQDIQGVAVLNDIHTTHSFLRYVVSGNKYLHICLYCDRVDSRTNVISGSRLMENNSTCVHEYKEIISAGERHWLKCTKCYNVKESYQAKNYYTVTLSHEDSVGVIVNDKVRVAYGEKMPISFVHDAPKRDGYEFVGYFSQPNGKGTQYYSKDIEYRPLQFMTIGYAEGYREVMVPCNRWYINGDGTLYAHWKLLETDYSYENIWLDNGYLEPSTIHIKHGTNVTVTAKKISGYKFKYFQYGDEQLNSETVTVKMELYLSNIEGIVRPTVAFFAAYEKDSCVAEGTLITLADGKQVPVESLTGNEKLLVWNLHTGTFDVAPILFIDKDPAQLYKVINLSFSDGTIVKVITEHGFWDYNLNKYVYLDEDAAQYIGHWFNKQTLNENGNPVSSRVQLTDVVIEFENTVTYSPVTYSHLCYYVNGMLSMPGGISGLFNIFEVNSETMKYDEDAMAADIEEYGLFTYEEFSEYVSISNEVFDAFNGEYLKVAIGKGLISLETLNSLAERYSCYFNLE